MAATTFDTLTYAKLLQEAGFTAQQAEAQAEALRAVVDQNLATKQDIELLRRDLKEMENQTEVRLKEMESRTEVRLKEMESRTEVRLKELDAKIELVRHEIELVRRETKETETRSDHKFELVHQKIELARRDTIIWLGGMIVIATAALAVLMKVL